MKTHGHCANGSKTRIYRIWRQMLRRCYSRGDGEYHRYGGRGITVCSRWHDFSNFLADMGVRPDGKTLDRIDGNGPYSPENCRWATHKEQSTNRRNVHLVEYKGVAMSLKDFAHLVGRGKQTLYDRVRQGWSLDQIVRYYGQD